MNRFKFYIRHDKSLKTVFAVGKNLTEAFEDIIKRFPDCAYVNHYEVV